MTTCVYCQESKPFTIEHVLTRGFAGQGQLWTLVDEVCGDCNAVFSRCETAWTGSPGEAIARIFHGPAGRKRKGRSHRIHPAEHVYMIQDGDPVAYEAEILEGLEPRVRPQIIWTGSEVLVIAPDTNGAARLQAALDSFYREREVTVYTHPNRTREKRHLIATLGAMASQPWPSVVGYEWRVEATPVRLDPFPLKPSRQPFLRRASVDAHERLRFRAENFEMAVAFLRDIQNQKSQGSGPVEFAPGYKVHIEQRHDQARMNRAIAKTAFNLGIKLLGRETMLDPAFEKCRNYCWSGVGDDPQHPFVGFLTEDNQIAGCPEGIRDRNEKQHVLMLLSNGQRVIGLVRLYGGPILRVHLGEAQLHAFKKCVVVDYGGAGFKQLY